MDVPALCVKPRIANFVAEYPPRDAPPGNRYNLSVQRLRQAILTFRHDLAKPFVDQRICNRGRLTAYRLSKSLLVPVVDISIIVLHIDNVYRRDIATDIRERTPSNKFLCWQPSD
jgi:hypothetical protein